MTNDSLIAQLRFAVQKADAIIEPALQDLSSKAGVHRIEDVVNTAATARALATKLHFIAETLDPSTETTT